jgi:hypothetical protein
MPPPHHRGGVVVGGYQQNPAQAAPDDQIAKQGVTTVDISALEQAPPQLDGLKSYIEQRLVPSMAMLHVSQTEQQSGHLVNQVIFGGFDGGMEVGKKHQAYYDAVMTSYKNIAKQLQDAADGTRKIIDKYKNVEERNAASAADIERAFASGASGTSPSTTTTTTSTDTGTGTSTNQAYN